MAEEQEKLTPAEVRSVLAGHGMTEHVSGANQLPSFFQSVEAVCSHALNTDEGLKLSSELDGGECKKLDDLSTGTKLTIQGCFVHVVEDVSEAGEVARYVRVALKCKEGNYYTYAVGIRQFIGRVMLHLGGKKWKPITAAVQKLPAKVGHRLGMVYLGGLDK